MEKKTFSILISALNEERNIGNLLNDILVQKIDGDFILEKVLVISDGSTDRTSEIVKSISEKNRIIELVINEKRIGKFFSLDKGFKKLYSDYIILFDADVRLYPDTINQLLKPLAISDYKVIGGNPTPIFPKSLFNISEQAAMFSWHLLQKITTIQPESIYSAHGRILMLRKDLYTKLQINELSTPGDDQYIYLKSAGSFVYAKDAHVSYKLPSSAIDYVKQSSRFRRAQAIKKSVHNDTKNEIFKIKSKAKILLTTVISHPWRSVCWSILYMRAYLRYELDKMFGIKGDKWGIAASTK